MSPSALFVTTVSVTLEAFLLPFAEHFRRQGWRIDALSQGARANEHIADSFDALFDISWSRDPLDPRNLVGSTATIRRVVEQGRYDIVHVHTPIAAFVTRLALRRLPKRPVVIYTAHGFHFYPGNSPVRNAIFRSMERIAAPWTDYLVTVNDVDFQAARALGGIEPDRVRSIPGIGVDLDRFALSLTPEEVARVRESLGVPQDAFMLTMIAEFAPVKRHAHVIAALSQVKSDRVRLVLVGDGPLETSVRERVVSTGLSERVTFAGYRRDIPHVLAASDAVLLASEREGLPRSVLEAMAASRAVIGTDTRGITDAVGDDSGWIVPKNDTAALARAIDQAAGDAGETTKRGEAGRRRATREFALSCIIDAYEELYREALSSRH